MAKKSFMTPFVLLSGWGGEGSDTGGGSGGTPGSGDLSACTYDEWWEWYVEDPETSDYNRDGDVDETDFCLWWKSVGLSKEAWDEVNPDIPWID